VDVHKGGKGGPAHVTHVGGQKRDFLDIINGWPLPDLTLKFEYMIVIYLKLYY